MNAQPEALRLADLLHDECGVDGYVLDQAAAELRRLHDENENTLKHFSEAVESYKVMAAQRDALLEALKAVSETAVYVSNGECSVSMAVVRRVDAAINAE